MAENDDDYPKEPASGVVTLDDSQQNQVTFSPICTYCKWWKPTDGMSCDAYPKANSIPRPIWDGKVTHVFPYPGDHGMVFAKADDVKRLPAKITRDLKKKAAQEAEAKATS